MGLNLVLDASAGVEILLDTALGRMIADDIPHGATWYVPEHYFVEVASAIRRSELRQLIPQAQSIEAFNKLRCAYALRRADTYPLLAEAWKRRYNVTVADALYVVLAEQLGATLVTADLKLANAVKDSLPVLSPWP